MGKGENKMKRYIDINNINLRGIAVFDQDFEALIPLSDVRMALQTTPTADVQEINPQLKVLVMDEAPDLDKINVLRNYLSDEQKRFVLLHCCEMIEQNKASFEKDDRQDFFGGMRRFTQQIVKTYQSLFLHQ